MHQMWTGMLCIRFCRVWAEADWSWAQRLMWRTLNLDSRILMSSSSCWKQVSKQHITWC